MATNPYFRNYNNPNEQNLFDSLVIESIRIYGVDTLYITRSLRSVDEILNEDDLSVYDKTFDIEMYVKTVDGFAGEGDFLSKFGLTIRDQVTFTVAIRTFEKHVTRVFPSLVRPLEGDLVYFPFNGKFFKIMHVEHESVFYQVGSLNVFDLKCELLEYSNERFETGIDLIDHYYDDVNTENQQVSSLDTLFEKDPVAKNIFFEEEGQNIIDFSEVDPFSEVISRPTNYAVTADTTDFTSDDTDTTSDTI